MFPVPTLALNLVASFLGTVDVNLAWDQMVAGLNFRACSSAVLQSLTNLTTDPDLF